MIFQRVSPAQPMRTGMAMIALSKVLPRQYRCTSALPEKRCRKKSAKRYALGHVLKRLVHSEDLKTASLHKNEYLFFHSEPGFWELPMQKKTKKTWHSGSHIFITPLLVSHTFSHRFVSTKKKMSPPKASAIAQRKASTNCQRWDLAGRNCH